MRKPAVAAKRRKTTGIPTGALILQPHGGALRNGGTNKGGPGRPKDEFKQLCQRLASGETTVRQVEDILKDSTHPQFIHALKWATEHGYGKPTESVEHSGTVEHKHQIWKFGDREVAF